MNTASASVVIADVMVLGKTTSGTAATGIGPGTSFGAENAAGTLKEVGTMEFALSSVGDGSESATMTSTIMTSGSQSGGWSASGNGIASDSATAATSVSQGGAFKMAGGVGIAKQVYAGLLLVVESAADAADHDEGVLVTKGGLGV